MTGDQVRAFRKKAGMTQRQLADHIGLAQASLSRIESGIIPVTRRTAILLLNTAESVGVPINGHREARPGRNGKRS